MAVSFMTGNPVLKDLHGDLKRRMDKAVADFQTHLVSLRTGRASVQLLDQVRVDYYGTPTPVTQVAQVTTPEAGMILVQPWDPSLIKETRRRCARRSMASTLRTTARSSVIRIHRR